MQQIYEVQELLLTLTFESLVDVTRSTFSTNVMDLLTSLGGSVKLFSLPRSCVVLMDNFSWLRSSYSATSISLLDSVRCLDLPGLFLKDTVEQFIFSNSNFKVFFAQVSSGQTLHWIFLLLLSIVQGLLLCLFGRR